MVTISLASRDMKVITKCGCVCVLCMRHMSILQNINMSRTVMHVNKIHQPVLHGNVQPAELTEYHDIKGAILDHSNAFAVE